LTGFVALPHIFAVERGARELLVVVAEGFVFIGAVPMEEF